MFRAHSLRKNQRDWLSWSLLRDSGPSASTESRSSLLCPRGPAGGSAVQEAEEQLSHTLSPIGLKSGIASRRQTGSHPSPGTCRLCGHEKVLSPPWASVNLLITQE